jgi:uncharacterized protein (DUF433 family)
MPPYQKIIKIDPTIRFGKPCVRQTRISVYDALSWLSQGMSFEQILADFPELTREDILTYLAFAVEKEQKVQYA